ncbi:unnamed protein product [marine sediment metagenome]|uniref:Chemoreceptor glutamine deamidase CheD n=1 Tax=marine sediment metagenome TaxID=412755 RepID=X0TYK6_9ZZZZ
MAISSSPGDEIVTHALGSCLGVTVYDPVVKVGGMMHVMMPMSNVNPEKARTNPFMFVDTGIPLFMKTLFNAGVNKSRMIVKIAGGANVHNNNDSFAIGRRNYIALKKLLWKNSVLIEAEDTGGTRPRTMSLNVATGAVTLSNAGKKRDL